jgi:hypothetical protein
MTVTLPVPFRSSRLVAGHDPLLGELGVALDIVGIQYEESLGFGWRTRVERVADCLGWPVPRFIVANGQAGPTLAFTAPCDQLLTAREANEWALCAALLERDPGHWGALREALRDGVVGAERSDAAPPNPAASIEEQVALAHLQRMAGHEAGRDRAPR